MKLVENAMCVTVLVACAILGESARAADVKTNAPAVLPAASAATQAVIQATRATPAPVAPVVVAAPAAVAPIVPEVVSQVVAQVEAPFVVTPFMAKYTARTAAGISNALVRWGVWAHGEQPKETEASEDQPATVPQMQFPTEQAVIAALNWLQREQHANGSWKGTKEITTPTLTSLALLAYLGHGETPASPAYGLTIRKGLSWLLADQDANGRFKGHDSHDDTLPVAALALTEAYGMLQEPEIKIAAEKAVALIVKGQHANGGFGYNLDKTGSDATSYMSWCAQVLAAARMAKLDVPGVDRAIDKASFALRQNADPAGGFAEMGPGHGPLSSAGVVGLQFLGAPHAPEAQKTLDLLASATFDFTNEEALPLPSMSHLYVAWNLTQAKFQVGGDTFKNWNKSMARALVAAETRERNLLTKWVDLGHWATRSTNEHKEAVIQDTCFGVLMLEVYYRYLPLTK